MTIEEIKSICSKQMPRIKEKYKSLIENDDGNNFLIKKILDNGQIIYKSIKLSCIEREILRLSSMHELRIKEIIVLCKNSIEILKLKIK